MRKNIKILSILLFISFIIYVKNYKIRSLQSQSDNINATSEDHQSNDGFFKKISIADFYNYFNKSCTQISKEKFVRVNLTFDIDPSEFVNKSIPKINTYKNFFNFNDKDKLNEQNDDIYKYLTESVLLSMFSKFLYLFLFFIFSITIIIIIYSCVCYDYCPIICKDKKKDWMKFKIIPVMANIFCAISLIYAVFYGFDKYQNLTDAINDIYCKNIRFGIMLNDGKDIVFKDYVWYGSENLPSFKSFFDKKELKNLNLELKQINNSLQIIEEDKNEFEQWVENMDSYIKNDAKFKTKILFTDIDNFTDLSNFTDYSHFIKFNILNKSNIKNNVKNIVSNLDGFDNFLFFLKRNIEKIEFMIKFLKNFLIYFDNIYNKGNQTKYYQIFEKTNNLGNLTEITNFLDYSVNYLNYLYNNEIIYLKIFIYFIYTFQVFVVFLSITSGILLIFGIKPTSNFSLQIIISCNWILSSTIFFISTFLVIFVYYYGYLSLILGETIYSYRVEAKHSCFAKDYSAIDNLNGKYSNETKKIDIDFEITNFNNYYKSIISSDIYTTKDLFEKRKFLSELKEYLTFIENANNCYYNEIEGIYTSTVQNSFDYFQRLLNYKASYPFQYYLECSEQTKFFIHIDPDRCDVPPEGNNILENDDIKNTKYCYMIKDVTEQQLRKKLQEINLDCKDFPYNNNGKMKNTKLLSLIIQRFSELKGFYNDYLRFKDYFAESIIKKSMSIILNITDRLDNLNRNIIEKKKNTINTYLKINLTYIRNYIQNQTDLTTNLTKVDFVITNFTDFISCDFMKFYPYGLFYSMSCTLSEAFYFMIICVIFLYFFNLLFTISGACSSSMNGRN